MQYYKNKFLKILISLGIFTVLIKQVFQAKGNSILWCWKKSQHKSKNLANINRFLEPFEIVPFDDVCSIVYSKIRSAMELKGTIMGPNDYIIAATVLAKNGILVTNNIKEFKRIKSLKVENWALE